MIFDYLTQTGRGKCKITIGLAGNSPVALVEELPENPGMSVTNAIETIATLLYNRHFMPLGYGMNDVLWITKDLDGVTSRVRMGTYWGRYTAPSWQHHSTEPIIQEFA